MTISNLPAFLSLISFAEGTDRVPDPYRCCFGFKYTIRDLSNHPAVSTPTHPAEWKGEPLDFLGPQYEGLVSTAAGRYQIIKPTWQRVQMLLHLPDFTAPSQDAAATQLIKEKGALDLVNSGQVAEAIAACSSVWASLPGSLSQQPHRTFAELIGVYSSAGGALV